MRIATLLLVLIPLAYAAPLDLDQPTRTSKRASNVQPFNVANPGPTPAFIPPADAIILPLSQVVLLVGATAGSLTTTLTDALNNLLKTTTGLVGTVGGLLPPPLCGLLKACPPTTPPPSPPTLPNCLNSTNTEQEINSLFSYGGANTTVFLCPGSTLSLSQPIQFTAPNQTLTTRLDSIQSLSSNNYATLKLVNSQQACAIYTVDPGRDFAKVTQIKVDGNRPGLGYLQGGLALMEMGGTNKGQVVDKVIAFEPRAWSTLHMIEGNQLSCDGAVVTNSQFGPAGTDTACTPTDQFNPNGPCPGGYWADGISLACRNAYVSGNTITDATDGAIVVFQSPGSTITGNTIISSKRQLLGGINSVDYFPFGGTYTGTKVVNNVLSAQGAMMKVGIAIGPLAWSDVNNTRTFDGEWSGNTFTSSGNGYFGYGMMMAGHNNGIAQDNKFSNANFGGIVTGSCLPNLPDVGPMYRNQYTTPGATLSSAWQQGGAFGFSICRGPSSSPTKTGVNL
ncbi:hypothetical protein OIO90_006451 [Microbotryomycetes sp. JL221]|nr:hypothetical protein OIO90_006451 [Microbotryomycetes sp. JL221]